MGKPTARAAVRRLQARRLRYFALVGLEFPDRSVDLHAVRGRLSTDGHRARVVRAREGAVLLLQGAFRREVAGRFDDDVPACVWPRIEHALVGARIVRG